MSSSNNNIHNETKIVTVLRRVFGKPKRYRNEYLFYCPFCNHHNKKLSINIKKNVYQCWVCSKSGRPQYLIRKFGTREQYTEYLELIGESEIFDSKDLLDLFKLKNKTEKTKKQIKLPSEYRCLINDHGKLSQLARNYLIRRGLTEDDIIRWKLGYCPSGDYINRIIIPSFDDDGYINYFIGRAHTTSSIPYLKPGESKNIIFNELSVDWDKPIILIEGVFDAIKAGENAIPILGSFLAPDSALLYRIAESQTPTYLALDTDAQKQEQIIAARLKRYGVPVYHIDIGKYNDVGEMPKEEFQICVQQAEQIDELYELKNKILNGVNLW